MKLELSHTRALIDKIMGMMQQLLQAKLADGGQQKEQLGGTSRRDANDDNGGAGRAPREKEAAGARVGATTATTAVWGSVSNQSSRASDESRPADDTGRRPEVQADVGPMINMKRGETKDSFLVDIAAHNSGGVLRSGCQRQPGNIPPVLKGKKGKFQKFRQEFLLKANMLDIPGHLKGQEIRVVPVGDPLKQKAVMLREGSSSEDIKRVYQAWNFIDGALQSE